MKQFLDRKKIQKIIKEVSIKQIWILSFLLGILGATIITAEKMQEMKESQIHIAEQVIRFHIRANSDTEEDQREKMLVKKQVVEYLQPLMSEANTIEEGREILLKYQMEIKQVAEQVLKNTTGRKVEVLMTKEKFPMKRYGDMVFPPGEYEALRVNIGEGKGQNWWCVMYPSLCFINETYGIVPKVSKEKLQHVLTEQDYASLKPEYHLKIVDKIKQWIEE